MIICDTNVWYDLGSGRIPKSKIEGKQLVCTHVNLRELVNTYNLVTNFEAVKNAVRAIRSYASQYYFGNPFQFGINRLVPSFTVDEKNGEMILKNLFWMLNVNITVPPDKIEEVNKYYEDLNKEYTDTVIDMNEIAKGVKSNIRKEGIKKKRRKEDTTNVTRLFLQNMFSSYSEQHRPETRGMEVQTDMANWGNLELIVETLADFFKEIELSATQKIQPNDWADVFNMVYVGKDDLYWTSENKWNRFIEHNKNASKYLFKP